MTDEVVRTIAKCRGLHTLTLAYPSVTEQGLEVVQQFGSLTSLSLPGTPLSDEIVAQWPDFPMLTHLDLSDTKITAKSMRKLVGSQSIERMALDRTGLKSTDLRFMTQLPYLRYLSLSGVGIDAKLLAAILDETSLSVLDLSDSDVSPEVLDVIAAKGQSLMFLMLRNNVMDSKRLMAIARSVPVFNLIWPAAMPQRRS